MKKMVLSITLMFVLILPITLATESWDKNWQRFIQSNGLTMETTIDMNNNQILNCPNCGGGGGEGKKGDGVYLYNDSSTMYLNETYLNKTIDNRINLTNLNYFNQSLNTTDSVTFYSANITTNLTVFGNYLEMYNQTCIVAKRGGDHTTIQGCIDSITDATSDKRYMVIVYPGLYTENIVGKNYVFITGFGNGMGIGAKVIGTSGVLYTSPTLLNGISNMVFELTPTTDGAEVVRNENGITGFLDCRFTVTNNQVDTHAHFMNISGGVVVFQGGQMTYNDNVDHSTPQEIHSIHKTDGALDIYGNEYGFNYRDESSNYTAIEEEDTTAQVTRFMNNNFLMNSKNCSYTGTSKFLNIDNKKIDKKIVGNIIRMVGCDGGTAYAYYQKTTDNNGFISSTGNRIEVTGFDLNHFVYSNSSNDTVESHFDDVLAINKSVTNGSFKYLYSDEPGQLFMSGRIGIGTDSPDNQVHIHSDAATGIGQFMQFTSNTTGKSGTSGFYFGLLTSGREGALYTGFGVNLTMNPVFGISGKTIFETTGKVTMTGKSGLEVPKIQTTGLNVTGSTNISNDLKVGRDLNVTRNTETKNLLFRGNFTSNESYGHVILGDKSEQYNSKYSIQTGYEYEDLTDGREFSLTPIFRASTGTTAGAAIGGFSQPFGTKYQDGDEVIGLSFGTFTTADSTNTGNSNLTSIGLDIFGSGGTLSLVNHSKTIGGRFVATRGSTFATVLDITNLYGVQIINPSAAGFQVTYLFDNLYQLYVEEPTRATNNYQVWLKGYGKNTGINFNDTTTKIYSNGSNQLLVDSFVYAELWNHTDGGVTQDLKTIDVYENFTGLIKGEINGFTMVEQDATNNHAYLITNHSGKYKIDYGISFSGTANSEIGADIGINMVNSEKCHIHRTITSNGAIGNAGTSCILDLGKGDIVTLMIRDEQAPVQDIDIVAVNFNLMRIGK